MLFRDMSPTAVRALSDNVGQVESEHWREGMRRDICYYLTTFSIGFPSHVSVPPM
jgi:hypothetical protein